MRLHFQIGALLLLCILGGDFIYGDIDSELSQIKRNIGNGEYYLNSNIEKAEKYLKTAETKLNELKNTNPDHPKVLEYQGKLKDAWNKLAEKKLEKITKDINNNRRWLDGKLREPRLNVDRVLEYREKLGVALEKQRTILESSEPGKAFIVELEAYLAEVDQKVGGLALFAEAEPLIGKAKFLLRDTKNALDRGEPARAQEYWQKADEKSQPLLNSKFDQVEQVKAFREEYEKIKLRVEKELKGQLVSQEVQSWIQELSPRIRWTRDALENQEPKKVIEYSAVLREKTTEFRKKYGENAEAQKIIKEIDALLSRCEKEIVPLLAKEKVDEILRGPIQNHLNFLTRALDEKNPAKVLEARKLVEETIAPLKENYSEHPKAQALLKKVEPLLQRVDWEMGDILAEKELKILVPKAESILRDVERAFDEKNVLKTQIYVKRLEKELEKFVRYQKYPKAKKLLEKGNSLLKQVDKELGPLMAEKEIEKLALKLEPRLKWLENALNEKNVAKVTNQRQAVVEGSIDLRSKYAAHPKASALLARLDGLLKRCDQEVGTLIADQKVAQVEKKIQNYLKWAEKAATEKDNNNTLVYLQKMNELIQPLRTEFPNHSSAQTLARKVDETTEKLGKAAGASNKEKDVAKIIEKAKPFLKNASQAESAGDLRRAAKELKQVNRSIVPLRNQFAFVSQAREFLAKLDSLNLKVFGKIPQVEASAPIFEINWRAPVAVQDVLKEINKTYGKANNFLAEAEKEPRDAVFNLGTALRYIRKVQDELQNDLAKVAPNHPANSIIKEESPLLIQHIQERIKYSQKRNVYQEALAKIESEFKFATMSYKSATKNFDGHAYDRYWPECLRILARIEGHTETARQIFPEAHPAVEDWTEKINMMKADAQAQMKALCVAGAMKEAGEGRFEEAQRYVSALEGSLPPAEVSPLKKDLASLKGRHKKAKAELAEHFSALGKQLENASTAYKPKYVAFKNSLKPQSLTHQEIISQIEQHKGKILTFKFDWFNMNQIAAGYSIHSGKRWFFHWKELSPYWKENHLKILATQKKIQEQILEKYNLPELYYSGGFEAKASDIVVEITGVTTYQTKKQIRDNRGVVVGEMDGPLLTVPSLKVLAISSRYLTIVPGVGSSLKNMKMKGFEH